MPWEKLKRQQQKPQSRAKGNDTALDVQAIKKPAEAGFFMAEQKRNLSSTKGRQYSTAQYTNNAEAIVSDTVFKD